MTNSTFVAAQDLPPSCCRMIWAGVVVMVLAPVR